jgi:hypothetical protein
MFSRRAHNSISSRALHDIRLRKPRAWMIARAFGSLVPVTTSQSKKSHSGGRRFDPVQLHKITTDFGFSTATRVYTRHTDPTKAGRKSEAPARSIDPVLCE